METAPNVRLCLVYWVFRLCPEVSIFLLSVRDRVRNSPYLRIRLVVPPVGAGERRAGKDGVYRRDSRDEPEDSAGRHERKKGERILLEREI